MMVIMVARCTKRRREDSTSFTSFLSSSPYHRIIFGLGLSDLLQSLSLALGPFASPRNGTQVNWSIGNNHTCTADGLIFTLSSISSPLYAFFLSFFCLCKVNWNMTNATFSRKFECKLHGFNMFINIAIGLSGLVTKSFNPHGPTSGGNLCALANVPTGCNLKPEIYGECDANIRKYSTILFTMSHVLVNLICLVGIIICMSMVCWRVLITTRILCPEIRPENITDIDNRQVTPQGPRRRSNSAASIFTIHQQQQQHKMELFIQAGLYVLSFIFTNIVPWIGYVYWNILKREFGEGITLVGASFFPLGGFFNILVHTRPKIICFRRKQPQYSWIRAFILVVKSGGVVPVVVASVEHEMNVSSEEAWADFRSIRTPPHANSSVLNAASSSCGINTFGEYDEESDQITSDRKYYGGIFPLVSQRGIITIIGSKSIMENEFLDLDDNELAQQSTTSSEEGSRRE